MSCERYYTKWMIISAALKFIVNNNHKKRQMYILKERNDISLFILRRMFSLNLLINLLIL